MQSVPPAMSKTSLPQTWHVPHRTDGINPREIQDIVIQQIKPPVSSSTTPKKKVRRVDGVTSTLYNPVTDKFGDKSVIQSLRDNFKEFNTMQINKIIPIDEDITMASSRFGQVAKGSAISYQQKEKITFKAKVHLKIDGGLDIPPNYNFPELTNYCLFVPTLGQRTFLDGLCVSLSQAILYEAETIDQSDSTKCHDLRSQRL